LPRRENPGTSAIGLAIGAGSRDHYFCRMVSKPRLCDIFETALLAGWMGISGATVAVPEPDLARTRHL
jgi:hypothetical protein